MAKKTIFFDGFCGYLFSMITEDGKLTEMQFERLDKLCAVGNIYKGEVENVLDGMEAAFVNCGLERNCYLSDENAGAYAEKYEGEPIPSAPFPKLKVGDKLLVQVNKLPVGNKGAKVCARLSFVGNYVIYLPDSEFVGVSRKISDGELRRNLLFTAKRIRGDGEGIVLRTAAAYADLNSIETEYNDLRKQHGKILERAKTAKVGELLYADDSLPARVLRDVLSQDVEKIFVGNARLKAMLDKIMSLFPADTRREVILHGSNREMTEEYGIMEQVLCAASPKAELENGGYLVIEPTEALTVIDVNTGKFTGDYNLEQTVYHTNLLAAREIARQVKLRNVGGIVVVDFIDMENETHNKAIYDELARLLKQDKAKCEIAPMSRFGLIEFTRKRSGANPMNFLIRPCNDCKTRGYIPTPEAVILNLRAQLMKFAASGAKAVRIDMSQEILNKLSSSPDYLADLKTRMGEIKILAVPHKNYRTEQLNFRADDFPLSDIGINLN